MKRAISLALVLVLSIGVVGLLFYRPESGSAGARVGDAAPTVREDPESGTQTKLEGAEEARPRSRAPQSLRMTVVDAGQRRIPGATVMWSPLDAAWIAAEDAWPDLDWEKLDRQSLSGITDEQGEVTLELPSAVPVRSVVWVTHAEHEAVGLALDAVHESSWPAVVRLEDRSQLHVHVSGVPDASSVATRVHQLADCGEALLGGLDPLARSARRAFHRMSGVDANGRATFAALPGEQRLWATCEALRSAPWVGRAPAAVELELGPTFALGGSVAWDRTATPTLNARVSCSRMRGNDREELVRTVVRADGSFGDLRIPVVSCDAYVVELEGTGITRQYVDLVNPEPDEHRTVTFMAQAGSTVMVRVIDPDALAVSNANVSVQWMEESTWRRIDRRTNSEGIASFDGLPPAAVWLRARAAGFVPNLLPQIELNLHDGTPIVVRLERAGVVEGQCLLAGKPAREFTVNFWKKEPKDGGKLEVRDSTDGRFRVDEAAPGEFVLFATGTTSIQSPQVRVIVDTAKPASCVLELPAPRTATGRVVAGTTGEPVASARVALQVRVGTDILRPWKEASPVGPTGAFSISGVVPGRNYLRVTADGFAPRVVDVQVGDESATDIGTIGLHQHGSIEVQLVGAPDQDFSAMRIDLQGVDPRPYVPVPTSGIVRFDGLMPGSYSPRIVFKDNSSRFLSAFVPPGRHVRVTTQVAEGGFEVEVEPGSSELAERLYELRVSWAESSGIDGDEFYPIRRGRSVRVRTLDTKRVFLEANDREGVVLGVGRFDLTGTPNDVVHFRVEGHSPVLRVVDRARHPIAGARVGVIGVEMDSSWARSCSTDGEGLCVLEGIAFQFVGISLHHIDHGTTPVQIIELPRDRTEPIELVLDAPLALRVQVLDHAARLSGIELFARDLGRYEDGLGPGTSDATGLAAWSQVAAGTYEVSVVHPGVWPDVARIEVKEAGEPVPLQVRRLGNVVFRMSTTLGNPVRDARIELECVERGISVATWIADGAVPAPAHGLVTDERGELAVRGLPNGEFRYKATLPSGVVLDGVVTVPPSATIDVPLRVE